MSEKDLTLERENSLRIHGADFEIFVDGKGFISLFFHDKFESIDWIVEQRKKQEQAE
jgi:hypothetical protein